MAHGEPLAQAPQVVWESGIALRVGILWDVTVNWWTASNVRSGTWWAKGSEWKSKKVYVSYSAFHIPNKNDVFSPTPTTNEKMKVKVGI